MDRLQLMASNAFATRFNHTLHAYIDIAGGLVEGTLLGQIMYWFTPDKDGNIRTQIEKDGEYWIAKKRSEWWDEIRITDRQYDRAIKTLLEKDLIIIAKYKFGGLPTAHIRPNYEKIGEMLDEYLYNIATKNSSKNNAQKNAQNGFDAKTGITQNVKRELHKTQNPYTKNNITENNNIYINNNNNICATETCATETTQAKTETDKAKQKKTNHSKQNEQTQTIDEMFSKFWEAYPKRKDKKRAYKVFSKIKPDDKLLQKMLDAIEREKQTLDWQKNKGQYIPYPSTWLSNERWNDEDMTVEAVTEIDVKRSHSPVQAKKNIALVSLSRASKNSVSEPVIGDIGDMWGSDDDEY